MGLMSDGPHYLAPRYSQGWSFPSECQHWTCSVKEWNTAFDMSDNFMICQCSYIYWV